MHLYEKEDVITILNELKNIERPSHESVDIESDWIDSTYVYRYLSQQEQELVDNARAITRYYLIPGDEPDKDAIRELKIEGFEIDLGPLQDNPTRLGGYVKAGPWKLDISD